ncbi:hypothetical protein FRC04_003621 [Tulasnella sp. 424]|nr:hypothetical protein FRC04_003621 [Tulasnella sp. 424]KAG8965272.1 hypothetical protein FRC05_003323 [Tulasnella sp. 425]
MKGLCRLRLVSTSWRDLLDATASFWVVISSTIPWPVNHTSIARSCGAPLIVHASRDSPLYRLQDCSQPLEGFLQLLGHTRDRWKIVWLDKYSPNIVPQYLASAAPLIETIHLGGTSPGRPIAIHLLGGETHNVRHLDLQSVPIDWNNLSFVGLRSLKLRGSVGERLEIMPNFILELLASNPGLEYLDLSEVKMRGSNRPSTPTVRLLHLQSIKLRLLETEIMGHLLRHIEAPNCQAILIQLALNHSRDASFILDECLTSWQPLFSALHKKNGTSNFYAKPGITRWRSLCNNGFSPGFEIMVTDTSFASSLRWAERVLDNLDPEGLEVVLDLVSNDVFRNPEVASTLRRVRCVTHIFAYAGGGNSRGIINLLREPGVQDSKNPIPPILPSLRQLTVRHADATAEEILQIVRRRFASSTQHPSKVSDLHIALEVPDFIWSVPRRAFDFATVTEIRSIKGVTLDFLYRLSSTLREGMLATVWDEELGEPAWGYSNDAMQYSLYELSSSDLAGFEPE